MDFGGFLNCLRDVVRVCSPAEVDGDGVLARSDVDDGGWLVE